MASTLKVDTIQEYTTANGVAIDGATIKDGNITAGQTVTTASGDGAISIASGVVKITKGSAAALTLAAPSSQDGTRITVISTTAHAHVITATDLIMDGTADAGLDTITFDAHPGASVTLVALGVLWYVESFNLVTVAGS